MTLIRCKMSSGDERASPLPSPPSRLAQLLALAHQVESLVEKCELDSYADAARELGVTRARMSQVLGTLRLAVPIQETILLGEQQRVTERQVRAICQLPVWSDQLAVWKYRVVGPHDRVRSTTRSTRCRKRAGRLRL